MHRRGLDDLRFPFGTLAGQGLITGVIVGFLPREQWEEYSLDSVSVITNDELE